MLDRFLGVLHGLFGRVGGVGFGHSTKPIGQGRVPLVLGGNEFDGELRTVELLVKLLNGT
jgi:hypothetical protein